jgi:hypothetical protein
MGCLDWRKTQVRLDGQMVWTPPPSSFQDNELYQEWWMMQQSINFNHFIYKEQNVKQKIYLAISMVTEK